MIGHFPQATPPNPPTVNCLMLWRKLVMAWDCRLAHLGSAIPGPTASRAVGIARDKSTSLQSGARILAGLSLFEIKNTQRMWKSIYHCFNLSGKSVPKTVNWIAFIDFFFKKYTLKDSQRSDYSLSLKWIKNLLVLHILLLMIPQMYSPLFTDKETGAYWSPWHQWWQTVEQSG